MRWDNLRIEAEREARLPRFKEPAVVRTFDAPEAMGIRFYEVRARSGINAVPKRSRMPFRFTINPYRGCTHACAYCFARPTHTYLDFNAREDFEREIVVKVNLPELVRAELNRPSWKGDHVALGTNTDPYQWVEGRYKLIEGIWEAMRDAANPCSVLTKSPLLLRDLSLFRALVERTEFSTALSVPTLDEKAWRETEPHTPHPRKRLEAVAELNRAGVPCGVIIGPLIPGVNDAPEQVDEILEIAGEAGATNVTGIPLHLRGEVREIWFDWLRQYRPDLIPRYEELYRRGAYVPAAEKERLAELTKVARTRANAPRWRGRRPAAGGPRRPDGDAEESPEQSSAAQPSLF
jgi:DNA repair photolyase